MTRRPKKPRAAVKKPGRKDPRTGAPKAEATDDAIKPEMTMQEAAARVLAMMRAGMKMDLRD